MSIDLQLHTHNNMRAYVVRLTSPVRTAAAGLDGGRRDWWTASICCSTGIITIDVCYPSLDSSLTRRRMNRVVVATAESSVILSATIKMMTSQLPLKVLIAEIFICHMFWMRRDGPRV